MYTLYYQGNKYYKNKREILSLQVNKETDSQTNTNIPFACTELIQLLWYMHPLLDNNHETNETTTTDRQRPANHNKGVVFSAWSTKQQWTATEEWCFLCSLSHSYIIRSSCHYESVSRDSSAEKSRRLMWDGSKPGTQNSASLQK
jgi:hypothetical protein